MVDSTSARQDVEFLLTKTLIYNWYDNTLKDLAYATQTRGTPTQYTIKVQVTIQRMDSPYVQEGILREGDLVGLFRFQYDYDAYLIAISPILVPKKGDEVIFINNDGTQSSPFVIKDCTPSTSEDSAIIGWDFKAGRTNNSA